MYFFRRHKIVLNKLKTQAANGVSSFSNVLISRLFGGHKAHKSDETAASNRAIKFLIPFINAVISQFDYFDFECF
jgi:hypothetical protein